MEWITCLRCSNCNRVGDLRHGRIRHLIEVVDEKGVGRILEVPDLQVLICGRCNTAALTDDSWQQIYEQFKKEKKCKTSWIVLD